VRKERSGGYFKVALWLTLVGVPWICIAQTPPRGYKFCSGTGVHANEKVQCVNTQSCGLNSSGAPYCVNPDQRHGPDIPPGYKWCYGTKSNTNRKVQCSNAQTCRVDDGGLPYCGGS
jgi:hypothetical protein